MRRNSYWLKSLHIKINKYINLIFNYLYLHCPQMMLGQREDWKIKLYSQYGQSFLPAEAEKRIERERKRLFRGYCRLLGALLLLLAFTFLAEMGEQPLGEGLNRPEFGEAGYRVPLKAEIRYRGASFTETVSLPILAREPTEQEKEVMLTELARRLPELIRGDNASLDQVTYPLNLLERDPETGAQLRWFSERPELLDETGRLDLVGVVRAQQVILKAELRLGGKEMEISIPVALCPPEETIGYEEGLKRRLKRFLSAALENSSGSAIFLPKDLGDGAVVNWIQDDNRGVRLVLLPGAAGLCLLLYRSRYRQIEREGETRRERMRKDFPDLANQIVLLLNAGLVVSSALQEVAEVYGDEECEKNNPLFYELYQIARRVRRSNASFVKEMTAMAQESGIRELIRFSSIVSDNVDKGSSLAEKLEAEGEQLRFQQKKRVEELARLAETKLSFPLMIQLLILILIAVAPVLFEV